jgi:hypothetical protein
MTWQRREERERRGGRLEEREGLQSKILKK